MAIKSHDSKHRIGASDEDTEILVKLIETLYEKLDDKNVQDKFRLGKEVNDQASSIISQSKHRSFEEIVRKVFEEKGYKPPPPPPDHAPRRGPPRP